MGRAVGVDFGRKRIGLAISDPNKIIGYPFKNIQYDRSLKQASSLLLSELREIRDVDIIILGLPKLLSNKDSEITKLVKKFYSILKEGTNISIVLLDERFTTTQADAILKEYNLNRKKRKEHVDKISAAIILRTYLDSLTVR